MDVPAAVGRGTAELDSSYEIVTNGRGLIKCNPGRSIDFFIGLRTGLKWFVPAANQCPEVCHPGSRLPRVADPVSAPQVFAS